MQLLYPNLVIIFLSINSHVYAENDAIHLMESCTDRLATKIDQTAANEIRIMSYNVENLFDAKHDKDKIDFQYMPGVSVDEENHYLSGPKVKYHYCISQNKKSLATCPDMSDLASVCQENAHMIMKSCFADDWTQQDADKKISQMKKSFDIQFKKGVTPDILILTEVENPKITTNFAKKIEMLNSSCSSVGTCRNKAHMGLVMTNGPDRRGIEVALVYNSKKLTFIETKTHRAKAGGIKPTRDILEVHFLVDDKHDLFVYGNHWPSQGGPTWLRNNVAYQLKSIIRKTLDSYPGAYIVAGGDFNTTTSETGYDRHPLNDILLKGSPKLLDLDQHSTLANNPTAKRGSYYYPDKTLWSHFDRFFVSKNLMVGHGLKVDLTSHQLHNHRRLVSKKSISIYRDELAAEDDRQRNGENTPYYGVLKSVESTKVKKWFKENNLNVVDVIESCAPKRFVDLHSRGRQTGYSDHFPISVLLRF